MRTSNALDLEPGVFTRRGPRAVALSLKRSAERSRRRKSAPFRSAMSMLVFHINRAGKGMPASQRKVLERAKDELRELYGKKSRAGKAHRRTRAKKGARRQARARGRRKVAKAKHRPSRRSRATERKY